MVNTRGMKSKTKSETESGIKTEIKAETKPETKPETKAKIKARTKAKTKPKTMSDEPSTSGLVLTAGPSWNVARQTPFGKKKRKKKDPNAPKKPMTAYFLYADDNRDTARRNLGFGWLIFRPGFRQHTQISKELGRMWRDEDEETKAHYQEISQRKMEQYKKDMAAYKKQKAEIDDH